MTDSDMPERDEWPRELWLRELEEHHNGTGIVVFSEYATIARFEGDQERDADFHEYIDKDIFDSSEKYWKHQIAALEAENGILRTEKHADAEAIAALEAERDRLREIIKTVKRDADEWAVSRTTGNPSLEQMKADALWRSIRRASASIAPIEASAALAQGEG